MAKNKDGKLSKKAFISAVAMFSLFWGAYQETKEESAHLQVSDGVSEVSSSERIQNSVSIVDKNLTSLSEQQQQQQQQMLYLHLSVDLCSRCCGCVTTQPEVKTNKLKVCNRPTPFQ